MDMALSLPVALVSMPWSAAKLPSIQLATLDAALRGCGLSSERHELYLDFCAQITPALYSKLANGEEFLNEWLFSRDYFGNEHGNWLNDFEKVRPCIELPNPALETELVEGLKAAAIHFLDRIETEVDWGRYDIVGFSLSTQQMGASIAMARRIKQRYPEVRVVFGGSMCTGEAGGAILNLCPYVDAVVRTEGEKLFPELIGRWREGKSLDGLKGVSHRKANGEIKNEPTGPLFQTNTLRPFINYDPYFEKVSRFDLRKGLNPMVAFESSRGCWWGEKSQCSFCGLHEIMKYRPKQQDFVLEEMEHLSKRHGHDRFYAVDLIAPKPFYETFFPEIERRGHKWQLFYEIKSNITRVELADFVDGGGDVIQPGIESLQDGSLRRMHKGAHPLQNIQLLKWCREMGVMIYWNYLMSLPGEEGADYDGAAEKVRHLLHLEPPSTIRDVLITRYAPYHKTPEKYGIQNLRPHRFYSMVFPVDQAILDDFAYLFEAEWETQESAVEYTRPLKEACLDWKEKARLKKPRLDAFQQLDGSLKILDTRQGAEICHVLTSDEAALYLLLDEKQLVNRLEKTLAQNNAPALRAIEQSGGITSKLDEWQTSGLVLREGAQVLALAVKRWNDEIAILPRRKLAALVAAE
jgi:ribosomal peptide maturation radical SAM protein 1